MRRRGSWKLSLFLCQAAFAETSSCSSAEEKEHAVLLKPEKLPPHSLRLDRCLGRHFLDLFGNSKAFLCRLNCSFRHMTVCHCLAAVLGKPRDVELIIIRRGPTLISSGRQPKVIQLHLASFRHCSVF